MMVVGNRLLSQRARLLFLLSALVAALAVPLARALTPTSVSYYFGPGMVRAEAVLVKGDGQFSDFRIDRGRIRSITAGSVTIRGRDGLAVSIPLAAQTKVRLNGRSGLLGELRPGMEAIVIRDGQRPADTVHAGKQVPSTPSRFFGPQMIRAEALLMGGGQIHDYRIDRGRIRAIAPGSITLQARDGLAVSIQVATTARVQLKARTVGVHALRRGMEVTTIRDGSNPADAIQVHNRR